MKILMEENIDVVKLSNSHLKVTIRVSVSRTKRSPELLDIVGIVVLS